MIENKHLGKFTIPDEYINKYPEAVKGIMGECVIISANHDENNRRVEYIAINNRFIETKGYNNPPRYKVAVIRHTNGEFDIMWQLQ